MSELNNVECYPIWTIMLVPFSYDFRRFVIVANPNINGDYPARFLRDDDTLGDFWMLDSLKMSKGCVVGLYEFPTKKAWWNLFG